jgi:hypothetical protein
MYIIRGTNIHIIVGTAKSTISGHENSPRKSSDGSIFNVISVLIDLAIILGLLISSIDIAKAIFVDHSATHGSHAPVNLAIDTFILGSFAL